MNNNTRYVPKMSQNSFNNTKKPFSHYAKKVIDINYVKEIVLSRNTSKTREKGRVRSKDIKMIVANAQTSEIGFGSGKAKTAFSASVKAEKNARRNLLHINTLKLKNGSTTLAQKIEFKLYGIKFIVFPSYNTKMQAAPKIAKILSKVGITAAKIKMIGDSAIANQTRGLIEGISKIESVAQIANRLGKSNSEILERHFVYREIKQKNEE